MEWIPFKVRELTDEEKKIYPEWSFIFDCPLPYDGQDILISVDGHVYMDTFLEDDYCYLDSGNTIETDGTMAWMPLPLPHYRLISESSDKDEI